ncbi:hypothetical protein BSKO_07626 [Bryopsis sp. KO-2023]|nr:hypothetical protein BSKO_07626 [Bryopsis sp. KO-2023]
MTATEKDASPPAQNGCVDKLAGFFFRGLEKAFARIGLFVGTRPWVLMLASLVVLIGCLGGMTQFVNETRGDKLWVPGGTEAQMDKDIVEEDYVSFAHFEEFIISSDPVGLDMLIPEVFDLMFEIQQKIEAFQVENPLADDEGERSNLTYKSDSDAAKSMCFLRGGVCLQANIIEAFDKDPDNWATRELILERINSGNVTGGTGEDLELLSVLGGVEYDGDDIISAKAIATNYFIVKNEVNSRSEGRFDEQSEAWEDEFLNILEKEAITAKENGFSLDRFATRSFSDEFGASIDGDLIKLNFAILLLLIYSIVMLSRWSEGCVGSRISLAIGGFISIGMAIACGLGLGSGLGLFYSPLMGVYPFLLIGIGVDDIFVLVSAYDRTPSSLPMAQRLSSALSISGSSITVTSLTDFFAFVIGSNTSLPALRNFSLFAALGILFTLLFQVTFFAGWLAYDEKFRRANNRGDVICCFTTPKTSCCGADDNILPRLMGAFGKMLAIPFVKIGVLLLFAAVAAVGLLGVTQIEVDADVDDFIPPGSYLGDWNNLRQDLYTTVGSDVGLYMQDVDFPSAEIQGQMSDLYTDFKASPFVVESTTLSWYEEFKQSEGGEVIPSDEFYPKLKLWLAQPPSLGGGLNFKSDIVLEDDKIKTCRFTGNHVRTQKSRILVRHMNAMRKLVREAPAPLGPSSFAYGSVYVEYEQYKAIGREAITNLGLALLMVLLIVVILLVNPLASIITFVCVALVVVELVGFMYFWGATIDNVIVIFLVISLGLSVDYAVHIAHAFLASTGTANERMIKALVQLGPAVFHGAMSTFMAVLVLSLSESYIFETFFRSLFLCVILGLAHGIILLPVALSILAPKSQSSGLHEKPHQPEAELTATKMQQDPQ